MHRHDMLEDHDRGLAFDLETIAHRHVERRRALAWLVGTGGGLLLAGCGGGGTSTTSTTIAATTTTATTTTATTTTGTTATTTSGQCVAYAGETNGPYPADGTNTASGSTSNVLTASGVVRSDIRASFVSSSTVAAGVPLRLTLTVVNTNAACAPLAGYAVYIWHCDANGLYSLYDLPAESYLRGVQVTDANGQVTFTTIVPGTYAGRYPHIHFELFTSLSGATTGRSARLISQLAIPRDAASAAYAAGGYGQSASRLAAVTIDSDNVFGDNSAAQKAAQTIAMSGSASAGYTGSVTIGVAG